MYDAAVCPDDSGNAAKKAKTNAKMAKQIYQIVDELRASISC
jgi:hypothetical protein